MKYFVKLLIIVMAIFALSSCGLKRGNPLDPMGNTGVVIPGDITGLRTAVESGAGGVYVVRLNWNNAINANGYYVYRSLGYNSEYQLVGETPHMETESQDFYHSSQSDAAVRPGEYWYRVASYNENPGGTLTGRYSSPVFVRIQ